MQSHWMIVARKARLAFDSAMSSGPVTVAQPCCELLDQPPKDVIEAD